VAEAVTALVGLQAQNPLDPYLALWSRLAPFDPVTMGAMVEARELVRIVVMRGTVHLVTAADAEILRPLMQPVLDAEIRRHRDFAPGLVGVDIGSVLTFARALLARQPRSGTEIRAAMIDEFPTLDAAALAYACRCYLPLVQVPPRGVWGQTSQVTLTTLESWLGRPWPGASTIDEVVVRYLSAFGPATVADATAWCRLAGLREVLERLRPRLRVFADRRGRELFDLPDAPRPDADVPAPVRFLPEYDNVLLSHADRSRFGLGDDRQFQRFVGPFKGAVLVDGTVQAMWHSALDKRSRRSTVVVEHLATTKHIASKIESEARRMAAFWYPDATERRVELQRRP
jgi:hypothetical protein